MKYENRKKNIDNFMEARGYNDLLIDDVDILIDNLLKSYKMTPPHNGNITKYSILKKRKRCNNMYLEQSELDPIYSRIDLETPHSILEYIYDNNTTFYKKNKRRLYKIREHID